jgi:hypothetical protein
MDNKKSLLEGVWVRYPAEGEDLPPPQRWKNAEIREVLEVLPSQYLIRDLDGEMELIPHERLNWSRLYPDLWSLANHYVQRPEDDPFSDKLDQLEHFSNAYWVSAIMSDVERWLDNPAIDLNCHGIAPLVEAHESALRPLSAIERVEYLMLNDLDDELGLEEDALEGYKAWQAEKLRRDSAG